MSVYVPVRLDARPRSLAPGCIRNASLSGAYIQTSVRLSPGTLVAVEFEGMLLHGEERSGIHACLVRQDARGLAVEWCEFAPEAIRALLARAPVLDTRSIPHAPHAPLPRGADSTAGGERQCQPQRATSVSLPR